MAETAVNRQTQSRWYVTPASQLLLPLSEQDGVYFDEHREIHASDIVGVATHSFGVLAQDALQVVDPHTGRGYLALETPSTHSIQKCVDIQPSIGSQVVWDQLSIDELDEGDKNFLLPWLQGHIDSGSRIRVCD